MVEYHQDLVHKSWPFPHWCDQPFLLLIRHTFSCIAYCLMPYPGEYLVVHLLRSQGMR